jgi:hypothetical protein
MTNGHARTRPENRRALNSLRTPFEGLPKIYSLVLPHGAEVVSRTQKGMSMGLTSGKNAVARRLKL